MKEQNEKETNDNYRKERQARLDDILLRGDKEALVKFNAEYEAHCPQDVPHL